MDAFSFSERIHNFLFLSRLRELHRGGVPLVAQVVFPVGAFSERVHNFLVLHDLQGRGSGWR